MKLRISVLAFLLWCGPVFGQAATASDSSPTELSIELERLKHLVEQQRDRVNDYSLDLVRLKRTVVQAKEKQDSLVQELESQAQSFMARQSQSERAIEQAHQQLRDGFAQQEQLNQELQEALHKKMSRELWLGLGAFVVLTVLFLMLSQRNLKKGLQQNESNWNRFQEHFLKTKHHE